MKTLIHPALATLSSAVLAAGKQTMEPGWSLEGRTLDVHDLIYVAEGGGFIGIAETSHPLLPNHWYILPAGVVHHIQHAGKTNLTLWVLHFIIQSEWSTVFSQYLLTLDHPAFQGPDETTTLMDLAIQAYCRGNEIGQILSNRTLDLILTHLLSQTSDYLIRDSRIAKAIQIIQTDYSNKLTLNSIGRKVGLGPDHFRELFSQIVGQSPSNALRNHRLQKAKELLIGSDLGMQQIANACGWENASTFIRTFSKQIGVTPGVFRELNDHSTV
jgi:AraC-like DNA-binding protein